MTARISMMIRACRPWLGAALLGVWLAGPALAQSGEGKVPADIAVDLDPGSPDPVAGGDDVSWAVRIVNLSQNGFGDGGVQLDFTTSSSPPGFTVTGSGSNWTCAPTSCLYTVPLPAGSTTTDLIISGTAPISPQGGTVSLSVDAGINSAFIFDPNPSNNSDSDSVDVLPELISLPDYAIDAFQGTPNPVDPGAAVEFSLVVRNIEDGGGRGVPFGSPLTVDFSLASAPSGATISGSITGTDWNCSVSSCTYLGQPLGPDEAAPVLLIPVQAPAGGPGSVSLSAQLGGDKNQANNGGMATVTVNAPVLIDYSFQSITGTPGTVAPGDDALFELVVLQQEPIPNGRGTPQPTVDFSLQSTPAGASLGQASGSNWNCGSSSCTYVGALSPGQATPVLQIPVVAAAGGPGSMTLQAQLSGDDVASNNQGSASIDVVVAPGLDLRFAQFVGTPASVLAGGAIAFDVAIEAISQQRGSPGNGIGFSYSLSATNGSAQLLGTPSGNGWNCSASSCELATSLAPGQTSPTVRFQVQAPSAAPSTVKLEGLIFGDDNSANNQGSASVQVQAEPPPDPPQLALDKQGPAEAALGQPFDYTLTVSNTGTVGASQINLSDRLPNGVTLVAIVPGSGWSCTASASLVDCNLAFLGVGQSAGVTLTARIDAPGEYFNEAFASASALATTLSDSVLTRVAEVPDPRVDLSLVKRDSVDPVAAGASLVYTIEISNLSNTPATGVTVTDTLPAGVTLIAAGGAGWSCSGEVVCTLQESLPGGQKRELLIEVTAPVTPGVIINRASVSSLELDINLVDNSDEESTTVTSSGGIALADLALFAGAPVNVDANTEFELAAELRNLGPDQAQVVRLNGQLQGPATLLGAQLGEQACTLSGSQFNCTLSQLPAEASRALRVRLSGSGASAGSIQLEVDSDSLDPQDSNNRARLDYQINATGTDVSISASASPDPVESGATLAYQLLLANAGPAAADTVSVALQLGPGQSIQSISGAPASVSCSGSGSGSGSGGSCQLGGGLAAGASATIQLEVSVSADPGSTLQASFTVSASDDANPANDRAELSVQVGERSEESVAERLGDAALGDPIAGSAVGPLAERCANPPAQLVDFCNRLLGASDEEVREVLAATAPEEGLSQSVLAREVSFAQFFNIDARLAELRGAAGGFSSAGLMLAGSGGSVSLGNLLAGEAEEDIGGLFGSPWGFFINGTISSGEQTGDRQRGSVGVDFESRGITAGVDYRFSNQLTAGLALGWADFDADISGDSSIDTQGLLLTAYGSWYPTERLYLDGRASFGRIDFEQARRIRFTLDGQTTDLLARGDADADQFSLAFGVGYHYNSGAWNITPNASVRYSDTSVDGFTERGADPFNLRFDATDTDSLLVAAGLQISRAFSTSRGVLTPQLSLSFNHENQDEDLSVVARFADGGTQVFRLDDPGADSTYGAIGLGMVYVGPNGVQAYLNYRTVFGYDDFDRDTINLGARFEF